MPDLSSYDRIYEAYRAPLLGYVGARLRDRRQAEDVAQEIWWAVAQDYGKPAADGGYDLARGTTYYTYILARFANSWIARVNRKTRHSREYPGLPGDETHHAGDLADPDAPTPEQEAVGREALARRVRAYGELFRLTFRCGGYPHQQFAFGFSKLIYGAPSARAIEGTPKTVDHEHGAEPLESLLAIFRDAYRMRSGITNPDRVRELEDGLVPVQQRLPLKVGELLELDQASRDQHQKILARKVARTSLRDYYAERKGGYTAAIPDWCDKLERRLRQVLGIEEEGDGDELAGAIVHAQSEGSGHVRPRGCNRCKLRHVPPCCRG